MHAVKRKPTKPAARRKKPKKKSSNTWKWISFISLFIATCGIIYFLITERKPMNLDSFRKTVPAGFASIGIDVSHHQGEIDWEKLLTKSGFDSIIHFVYCKATEGNTHIDTRWEYNRKTLNEMGIPNGAYHFFIPTNPGKPQADHFLTHWKKRDIDLPPVLDVETEGVSDKKLIENMQIWLDEVEKQTGMQPVIYTSLHFYETKFSEVFESYKFWIAAYSRKPECINDERIIHWQYSETGELPGISEKVDLNVSKLNY